MGWPRPDIEAIRQRATSDRVSFGGHRVAPDPIHRADVNELLEYIAYLESVIDDQR